MPPLTPDPLQWATEKYLPNPALGDDWRQSPILIEDKAGLSPALVMVGERDPLSRKVLHTRMLWKRPVPVTKLQIPGMVHGFITMSCMLGITERALDLISSELRKYLSN